MQTIFRFDSASIACHIYNPIAKTITKYDGTWNTMLVDYCFFSLKFRIDFSTVIFFSFFLATQFVKTMFFIRYLALFIRMLIVVTLLNKTLEGKNQNNDEFSGNAECCLWALFWNQIDFWNEKYMSICTRVFEFIVSFWGSKLLHFEKAGVNFHVKLYFSLKWSNFLFFREKNNAFGKFVHVFD